MPSVVFFRTEVGPKTAEEFASSVPEGLRERLYAFVKELRDTGRITQGRSGQVSGGDWSVWIEDEAGERHNFLLYVSRLESGTGEAVAPARVRKLGRWEELPGRPQDNLRWVEAASYIEEKFSGRVREQLLERLERALRGLPLFDGTIEYKDNRVILRAVSQEVQVRAFDAEVEFEWEDQTPKS